ncbi:EamA family transporter [Streptomyces diacarni]|uniref:EamA family transporter n=1 Tax=Streptomyces diacarni TaxID=2800381 RepID=UPI001C68C05C|nr:EamA family transporter [Streptomyces diacarni]
MTLRLGLAGLVLLALWRPRRPPDRRSALLLLAFGTAIAGMNLSYLAMAHLPLGVVMTIQLSGPLAVFVLPLRRWMNTAWGLLAAAGLALFTLPGSGGQPLDPRGVAWAAASGVSMAAYLLLSRRTGAAMSGGGPLALAVCWAAVLTLPLGLADAGARLAEPRILLAGLGVAVLSAAVPYSLELAALRRLPAGVVGVLQSLEPVAAGFAGLILLGERLSGLQWLAVGCITLASAGAVAGHRSGGAAGATSGPSDEIPVPGRSVLADGVNRATRR